MGNTFDKYLMDDEIPTQLWYFGDKDTSHFDRQLKEKTHIPSQIKMK